MRRIDFYEQSDSFFLLKVVSNQKFRYCIGVFFLNKQTAALWLLILLLLKTNILTESSKFSFQIIDTGRIFLK